MSEARPPVPAGAVGAIAKRARTEPAVAADPVQAQRTRSALKAAVLITALGPETAGRILGAMTEAHIRQFAHAISKVDRIPPGLLEAAIADFLEELGDGEMVRGGADQARAFIGQVLDDASVARIMDGMQTGGRSIWAELAGCPDRAIADFLEKEHPQTSAVILSEMRTDKAARILEKLEPSLAQAIVLRLSRVPRVDRDVMEIIQDVISRDVLTALRREKTARKPADLIGGLLNNISDTARDRFLKVIEAEKPEFAQEVIKVMFTFGDIATRVETRDVSTVVRNVNEETLMTALKAGQANYPQTVEFILGNLSKRLSERYVEDLAAMAEIKRRAGEAAQMEVVKVVQALAQKGEIKLVEMDGLED